MPDDSRLETDKRPRCPRCGEPARSIFMVAKVEFELGLDGEIGKVLHSGHRTGAGPDHVYVCGGGHKWTKEAPRDEQAP